jgi:hypothetical protein
LAIASWCSARPLELACPSEPVSNVLRKHL